MCKVANEDKNVNLAPAEGECKVSFFEKIKETFKTFYSNKKLFWLVVICALVVVGVGVGVLITVLGDDTVKDTPNTGETLNQTYSMGVEAGLFAGSSSYAFSDDNKVVVTYATDGNPVVNEYQYVIAIEGGKKVIKLTRTNESGTLETTTHEYEKGTLTKTVDGKKVTYDIIFINGVQYTCSEPKK